MNEWRIRCVSFFFLFFFLFFFFFFLLKYSIRRKVSKPSAKVSAWRVTIINYNRRLSKRPEGRNEFPDTFPLPVSEGKDRWVQYVWGQYNTSNRDEMPFHKFFWAFKARNNIWLEIGVAGSPSGKKCYLRFPKPETRRPVDHHSTHLQPLLPTKHLPLHFNHYFW